MHLGEHVLSLREEQSEVNATALDEEWAEDPRFEKKRQAGPHSVD
jgi:hypothetical protein